jgi:predicted enzyme related to lactoylglutathione lyase
MERVVGIGGVFVRAADPEKLARWYGKHLGLEIRDSFPGATFPLSTPDAPAGSYGIWGSFPEDSDYLGSRDNMFMVNLRVADLDAMLTQLRAGGCDVADHIERSEYGQFGWVTDPEGNRVELWQPPDELPAD